MYNRREFLKLASLFATTDVIRIWAEPAPSGDIVARSTAAPASRRLVFVHGRDQQGKDSTALKTEWLATLNRGGAAAGRKLPAIVDVAFPFYGDLLARFAAESQVPLTSEIHSRGGPAQDDFVAFQADFANDVRMQAGISDAAVVAEYGNKPQERGPLNWAWVQAILRAIDKNGTGMSGQALETFTRDVYLYTTRAGVRDEVDAVVAASLTEEPAVVVSHSLGTIVAYNVLRSDRRALKVPLFVTVGSPLGIRAVRDQLRPLRSPRPVAAWYNAYDRTDVVSLYPLDGQNFPVLPAIENNGSVHNHTDNHHGISGYLDDPVVSTRILDALGA